MNFAGNRRRDKGPIACRVSSFQVRASLRKRTYTYTHTKPLRILCASFAENFFRVARYQDFRVRAFFHHKKEVCLHRNKGIGHFVSDIAFSRVTYRILTVFCERHPPSLARHFFETVFFASGFSLFLRRAREHCLYSYKVKYSSLFFISATVISVIKCTGNRNDDFTEALRTVSRYR